MSDQEKRAAAILNDAGPIPLCPGCIWPEVEPGQDRCPDCDEPVIWTRVVPAGPNSAPWDTPAWRRRRREEADRRQSAWPPR